MQNSETTFEHLTVEQAVKIMMSLQNADQKTRQTLEAVVFRHVDPIELGKLENIVQKNLKGIANL
jgi:hypothetical protein